MALLDFILQPIENLFNRIFGGTVVGKLVSKITDGITHVLTLVSRIDTLVSSIKSEVAAFASWKEDFQIKNKVINLPKAVERTQDFIAQMKEAWQAVLDLVSEFRDAVKGGGDPQAEAEEVAADLGDLSNVGESLLKKLPKLSKGLEKMLGVVSLIVDGVIQWSNAIDSLQKIVDAVTALRQEIESGSTFFLGQGNRRKIVTLTDGSTMKIRLGKLHGP